MSPDVQDAVRCQRHHRVITIADETFKCRGHEPVVASEVVTKDDGVH